VRMRNLNKVFIPEEREGSVLEHFKRVIRKR
jgi:hypothetical protein